MGGLGSRSEAKESTTPMSGFVENNEGELEMLDEIEKERESRVIEKVQNKLDEEQINDLNLYENEIVSSSSRYKKKPVESNSPNALSGDSDDLHATRTEVILSPIDDSKEITLVDAIISTYKGNSPEVDITEITKVDEYLLGVYELPPPFRRTFVDEIPTRDKFFGIRFPFGARLMRFRIDRKTAGHPRHEYRYAPILKHSVGVDGSEVTKFSVFQTIAWNELAELMKGNYRIPDSTRKMMKSPTWKASKVSWNIGFPFGEYLSRAIKALTRTSEPLKPSSFVEGSPSNSTFINSSKARSPPSFFSGTDAWETRSSRVGTPTLV
ncbi:secreted acid phosphatase [Cryptosporidium felis]|nr:secreted acid phosphatase [Cryptosporidium felis]